MPADPPAYELWYSYAAGRNPEMNRRINRVLDENGSLSIFELDGIYDEYMTSSRTRADLLVGASGPSALSGGFRLAFAVAAGFSLLGALAAAVLLRSAGTQDGEPAERAAAHAER